MASQGSLQAILQGLTLNELVFDGYQEIFTRQKRKNKEKSPNKKNIIIYDVQFMKLLSFGFIRRNLQALLNVDINPSDISVVVMKYLSQNHDTFTVQFGCNTVHNVGKLMLLLKSKRLFKSSRNINITRSETVSIEIKDLDARSGPWGNGGYSIEYGLIGFNKHKTKKDKFTPTDQTNQNGYILLGKYLTNLTDKYSKYDATMYTLYFGCCQVGQGSTENKRWSCNANIDGEMEMFYDYGNFDGTVSTSVQNKKFELNKQDTISLKVDFVKNRLYFVKNKQILNIPKTLIDCEIEDLQEEEEDGGVPLDFENYEYYYSLCSQLSCCPKTNVNGNGFRYKVQFQSS